MSASNVRIRYGSSPETNTLKSRRVFTTNTGVQVSVELDTAAMVITIKDAASGDVVVSARGETINLAVLKIKAKEQLEKLGVSFADEARAPKRIKSV